MKKVLINVEERELRVAILEDEQLVELYIESLDEKSILNNIYKGRVEDVLPGLKAAFVNVGLDRNAFLHFDDVRPDLLWAKYRELHPEMADEVPTAREALAESGETDQDETGEADDRRKRRRGRRGGKKRRPDSEDTYSPGLPVGVTEDDLEDEEEEETEIAASGGSGKLAAAEHHRPPERHEAAAQQQQATGEQGETSEAISEAASADAEARRLARQERQRQRRERWEQRKLERQQRRQQERAERAAQGGEPGNAMPPQAAAPQVEQFIAPEPPPAAYGTRGAASAYDTFNNAPMTANQRRQNKARYGDNFGNIAPPNVRRNDHRDSQVDFFGPSAPATEEESSIWDERQPNLGPVPGLGKAFLDIGGIRRERRGSGGHGRRQASGNQNQQNQNRNRKANHNNNKRRGGKKRSMRKRDNRSYFAFSADDIDKDIPMVDAAPDATEEKPKKVTRKRKTAPETDGEAKPKKTARKTATKKTTAKASKGAAAEADSNELPLNIAAPAETAPVEKPKRARKTTATRTRKTAAKKSSEEQEDLISAKAPQAKPTKAATAPVENAPETEAGNSLEAVATVETVPSTEIDSSAEAVATTESAQSETAQAESAQSEAAPAEERPSRRRRSSRAERAARHRQQKSESAPEAESVAAQAESESQPAEANLPVPVTPASAQVSAPPPAPAPQEQQQHGHRKDRDQRRRLRKPQFQEVFRKGDEIMVQVVKEEIGMKGARISSYVSLPGRYLVLLPYPNQEGGISRKVEDIKERKRLKNLLRDISSDDTAFIVRTAGIYQEEKEIRNDVEFLSQEWKTIADKFAQAEPKSLVYDDHDILYRLARDVFDDSVSEILIDSHVESEKLKGILGKLIPGLVDKVKLYSGAENIFQKYGINKMIQKAARRKVWLKSGGYLIIDEAEALTAIDVNTGKSVGKDDQEKLILRTNLEAARAVARELKLRDIGGLIVIDFIDMRDTRNKDQVLNELKLQLRKDRSKTSVSAISEFGLVEMTRKRVRRSLRKTIFMDCPYCQGAGVVLNEQQIWLHIKHEIVRQLESVKPAPTLNITVNPKIRAYVDQNYRDVIRRLEQKYDTEIRITMSDIFHIENYQIEKLETTGVINGSATVPGR